MSELSRIKRHMLHQEVRDELDSNATQLAQKEKEQIGLPLSLLEDTVINPAQQIEEFLNQCSNKKVVFPYGKSYALERQIILSNITNIEIDLNGSLLKLPDNLSWSSRTIDTNTVSNIAIYFYNCSNIKIHKPHIDGNKTNNSPLTKNCIGMFLKNVDDFTCYDFFGENINYHSIVISTNTKGIKFYRTRFKNGGQSAGGESDVYVSNDINSNFQFYDTFSEREGAFTQNQIFYIDGYNGTVKDIKGKNVALGVDCRKGTHIVENLNIDRCWYPLIVSTTSSSGTNEAPSLYVKNVVATNCYGLNTSSSLLYITACELLSMENVSLEASKDAVNNQYGVQIRKTSLDKPIKNLSLKNIVVKNVGQALLCRSLTDENIFIERLTGVGNGANSPIRGIDNTVNMIIKNYKFTNFDVNKPVFHNDLQAERFIAKNDYPSLGTTAQRPTGISRRQTHQYFDKDLNKMIYWNGTSWIDGTGNTV